MPSDLVKIRVRAGNSEAEIEADLAHIREAIELIPELVKQLPNGAGTEKRTSEPLAHQEILEDESAAHVPIVTLEKHDSLTEILEKFFRVAWGKEKRKLSDVRDALQSYGLNYPKQSVAVALLRLSKGSKVRRFKAEDGEYVYTASTPLMPEGPALETRMDANV